MHRLWILSAALAVNALAQPAPTDLLARVRQRVTQSLDRLPRYLCTQSIDRSQFEPDHPLAVHDCAANQSARGVEWQSLRTTADRLRLDVGVGAHDEIYSWVGENRFGSRSLFEIVNGGSMSTGFFRGFLDLVFQTDSALFLYRGETTEGGRKLAEYRYQVPAAASHYMFQAGGQKLTTAYEGAMLADPATAELVRLTVRTIGLPPETGTCEAVTTMDYRSFAVNQSEFLLPSRTTLHIKNTNGLESVNQTLYSGCHEFLGESTVKFEAPPDAAARTVAAARTELAIPAGLRFTVELAESIPVASAAAGDIVKARLATDLRESPKKPPLARAGTPAVCRILRLRRFYYGRVGGVTAVLAPLERVELLLRLESLTLPGGPQAVFAEPWVTRFEQVGDDFVIPNGLLSTWVTLARQ